MSDEREELKKLGGMVWDAYGQGYKDGSTTISDLRSQISKLTLETRANRHYHKKWLEAEARIAELEAALKQSARVEASLASRIANLMDALEPFADVKVYPVLEDTTRVYDEPITYGDLRAARAALGEKNDN